MARALSRGWTTTSGRCTLSKSDHRLALKEAKVARKSIYKSATGGPKIRGQTSILSYSRSRVLPMEDEERESISVKGTRNFPMFPLAQGREIDRLLEYLLNPNPYYIGHCFRSQRTSPRSSGTRPPSSAGTTSSTSRS